MIHQWPILNAVRGHGEPADLPALVRLKFSGSTVIQKSEWPSGRSWRKSASRTLAVASLAILAQGCSSVSPDGRFRTYPVFGFGLITSEVGAGEHRIGKEIDARCERFDATGVMVSGAPGVSGVVIGQTRRQVVEVSPEADLLIDAKTSSSDHIMHVDVSRPDHPVDRPQ